MVKPKKYFKVLGSDLRSVGLLGAYKMQYEFGVWNKPNEPISSHPRKGGGLWVAPTKAAARSLSRYILKKYGIETRIFSCMIGRIIYETSCRIKTDRVFFDEIDEIL